MQIKELKADWHIAAARAIGRDKSGPYTPAGAGWSNVAAQ
jgi:hypothetical protein